MREFRVLCEDLPCFLSVHSPDLHARFRYANLSFARTLGFAPGQLLHRELTTLSHPYDVGVVLQAIQVLCLVCENSRVTKGSPEAWAAWEATTGNSRNPPRRFTACGDCRGLVRKHRRS